MEKRPEGRECRRRIGSCAPSIACAVVYCRGLLPSPETPSKGLKDSHCVPPPPVGHAITVCWADPGSTTEPGSTNFKKYFSAYLQLCRCPEYNQRRGVQDPPLILLSSLRQQLVEEGCPLVNSASLHFRYWLNIQLYEILSFVSSFRSCSSIGIDSDIQTGNLKACKHFLFHVLFLEISCCCAGEKWGEAGGRRIQNFSASCSQHVFEVC